MTITVGHSFTSAKAQSADASLVSKNEWNAGHVFTCATGVMLGRTTAGSGSVEEITPNTGDFSFATGALALAQPEYIRILDNDATGSDVNTAQPVFPTAGTFTALGSTTYLFDAFLHITRSAGSTSHTTSLLFGGTASFVSMRWIASIANPTGVALGTPSTIIGSTASAVVVTAANTSTTENLFINWNGILRVNAVGTIIPQFQYSAAPGGAPSIRQNTYFRLKKLGAQDITAIGSWA